MAFAQSVHNQSSVLKINLMVVDDDPVFLEIMSRMLEKSKYRDPSVMEVTVRAAKDSQEALSTLKVQRNNIDLIITDYYMPDMNGLQLKKKINREFGNFPIIVISADANIEQESLTSGALCFLPKPIKPCDLPKIYESALICKRNGKSTLLIENNQNDHVPQNTQLLPDQAKVMKTKKKIGSCVGTDGSRKNHKRPNVDVDDESPSEPKKMKITWTDNLHDLFLRAIRHIGLDKAVPKKILEYMNIPYLTRENVASHLQKYRMFLRKVSGEGLQCTSMESMFLHGYIREPYVNYYTPSTSWYDSSLNSRTFYTKPGHGFGQSRLLSTTREPVRFNQMASYSYMNRPITYEPNRIGSNVTLPMAKRNLNFSNQLSQNEGRTCLFQSSVMENNTDQTYQVLGSGQQGPSASNCDNPNCIIAVNGNLNFSSQPSQNERNKSFFQPSVMANNTDQTYQVLGIGQDGPSAINGNNPNCSVMGKFERFTPYQGGPSHFSYGMQSFSNNENAAYNHPEPHTSAATIQPYNPEPHTNATVQPYNAETHTDSNVQPYNPEPHATIQPYNPEPHTSATMQPFNPEPHTNATMQPFNPEPHTNATMQPINPEPHINATMQPYNAEPHTNATMQPINPEPHTRATIQPNLEVPQLENLNIYGDLSMINEVSCNISNFHFDNQVQANLCEQQQQGEGTNTNFELPANFARDNTNFELPANLNEKQQGEGANTNFEHPANIATELNEILSLDDNAFWNFVNPNQVHSNGETSNALTAQEMYPPVSNMNPNQNQEQGVPDFFGDNSHWTFVNTNQGHFNGETSNALTTREMYPPVSNMNPNQNQDQDVPNFIDGSSLNQQELVDDFLSSLFNDDMN